MPCYAGTFTLSPERFVINLPCINYASRINTIKSVSAMNCRVGGCKLKRRTNHIPDLESNTHFQSSTWWPSHYSELYYPLNCYISVQNLPSSLEVLFLTAELDLQISVKGKAVPKQVWTGPKVSRTLRSPDLETVGTCGKVVSPKHRPPLSPRKYSW